VTTPKPKSPPWTASERVHRWTLSLESTGVRQDAKVYSGLFSSASINKHNETARNTDFDEGPRLVKFEGMIMNDLGRWLGSSPEEFGEIVHPSVSHGQWRKRDLAVAISRSDRERLNACKYLSATVQSLRAYHMLLTAGKYRSVPQNDRRGRSHPF
jgi:hypothetical protein